MPYITKERAGEMKTFLGNNLPKNPGELNYTITNLLVQYIASQGVNYATLSSAIGVTIDAAEECRRRLMHSYEDKKMSDEKNIDPYALLKHFHSLK